MANVRSIVEFAAEVLSEFYEDVQRARECPITYEPFEDPVYHASGPTQVRNVFERRAIQEHINKALSKQQQPVCPLTRVPINMAMFQTCEKTLSVMRHFRNDSDELEKFLEEWNVVVVKGRDLLMRDYPGRLVFYINRRFLNAMRDNDQEFIERCKPMFGHFLKITNNYTSWDFTGIDISNLNLAGCILINARFDKTQLLQCKNLLNTKLDKATLALNHFTDQEIQMLKSKLVVSYEEAFHKCQDFSSLVDMVHAFMHDMTNTLRINRKSAAAFGDTNSYLDVCRLGQIRLLQLAKMPGFKFDEADRELLGSIFKKNLLQKQVHHMTMFPVEFGDEEKNPLAFITVKRDVVDSSPGMGRPGSPVIDI